MAAPFGRARLRDGAEQPRGAAGCRLGLEMTGSWKNHGDISWAMGLIMGFLWGFFFVGKIIWDIFFGGEVS